MSIEEVIAIAKTLDNGFVTLKMIVVYNPTLDIHDTIYRIEYGDRMNDRNVDQFSGDSWEAALRAAGWKPKQDMSSIDELSTPIYFEEE